MSLQPSVARDLLKRAAALLEAHHPACRCTFARGGEKYLARLAFPGVVIVVDAATGELCATSLPGQPTELA